METPLASPIETTHLEFVPSTERTKVSDVPADSKIGEAVCYAIGVQDLT